MGWIRALALKFCFRQDLLSAKIKMTLKLVLANRDLSVSSGAVERCPSLSARAGVAELFRTTDYWTFMGLDRMTNGTGFFSDLNMWETAVLSSLGGKSFVFYTHIHTHIHTSLPTYCKGKLKITHSISKRGLRGKGFAEIQPHSPSLRLLVMWIPRLHITSWHPEHVPGVDLRLALSLGAVPTPSGCGSADVSCSEGRGTWNRSFSVINHWLFISLTLLLICKTNKV